MVTESVENIKADVEIDLLEDGLDVKGTVSYSAESGDACVVIKADFVVDVKVMSFTREDVLAKLYKNMALAASIVGPNSNVVEQFEVDISDVKAGGELVPHAWMFELE